jgi:hypothetical protein
MHLRRSKGAMALIASRRARAASSRLLTRWRSRSARMCA